MRLLDWARQVKPDLVKLQQQTRIPALFAAAQMIHESAVIDGDYQDLSRLAREHHNYAGLKWAEWQKAYGCKPVSMGTWEVLDGERVDVTDAFCSCETWEQWLQVYAALLTGQYYSPALRYADDPLLYGSHVWERGYATDPAYVTKVARWMMALWKDYADTLPQKLAVRIPVQVQDWSRHVLADGYLEGDKTWVPARELLEAMGLVVEWDKGVATVRWPGRK